MAGGTIALLEEGDTVVIDLVDKRIDVSASQEERDARASKWTPPVPKYTRGVLAKYTQLVSHASEGATVGMMR